MARPLKPPHIGEQYFDFQITAYHGMDSNRHHKVEIECRVCGYTKAYQDLAQVKNGRVSKSCSQCKRNTVRDEHLARLAEAQLVLEIQRNERHERRLTIIRDGLSNGKTQRQIADDLGLHPTMVCRYLRGDFA